MKSFKGKEVNPKGSSTIEFKFNVDAPEFIPKLQSEKPVSSYLCSHLPFLDCKGGDTIRSDKVYFVDQQPDDSHGMPIVHNNTNASGDKFQKIVKQVEYQFSDASLISSDFILKIMSKDSDGYVPIAVVASWKKIQNLRVDNQTIINALRTSPNLIVSEDGKKVRRMKLFTEKDREELMSRIVIVENLPDGSSRQSIEKTFGVVGSVKNIRISYPQTESNGTMTVNNKLQAFVEFETTDQADKAVDKLNDAKNLRKGFRVRLMVRRTPRSVIKGQNFDQFDLSSEDDQSPLFQNMESPKIGRRAIERNAHGKQKGAAKRVLGRGRAKPLSSQTPQKAQPIGSGLPEKCINEAFHRPKVPDGTRGFTMGRGKHLKPPKTAINLPHRQSLSF